MDSGFTMKTHLPIEQSIAGFFGLLLGSGTGIALIDESNFDSILGDFLHGLRQFLDLRTLLFVGWCNMCRQQ